MKKRPKLTSDHYHEIIDRLHIITCTINDHILQHPVCKLDKDVCTKVETALDILYEAYQLGVIKMFKDLNDTPKKHHVQSIGLLNYEGDVLKMKRVNDYQFEVIDEWKVSLGLYTREEIQDFIQGKLLMNDSQGRTWNFAAAHENAKPSIEVLQKFIR